MILFQIVSRFPEQVSSKAQEQINPLLFWTCIKKKIFKMSMWIKKKANRNCLD